MPLKVLIEGPFESDYSLAIVNRNLAYGMLDAGCSIALHQRDNTTNYPTSPAFQQSHPRLAPYFQGLGAVPRPEIHTRYIYPPHCDNMHSSVRAFHCYGWEESAFPPRYTRAFNAGLDLVTVMSEYVKQVLTENGVTVPVEVVGLGADHILRSPAVPVRFLQPGIFHFVHVSSCFPRKGADVLVRAFCEEFRQTEDVCLIIKTFPNPHNKIEELVGAAERRYPGHAPIRIISDSLSHGEMRFLLENGNCLVSASRGEGFGLPVAEAMLLGCPVIATIHGGQADLCSPEWCWPVEFRVEPAQTHLTEGVSYWAEPSVDSLREQMRAVFRAPRPELTTRAERARAHIAANFSWAQVARRHLNACEAELAGTSRGTGSRPPADCGQIGFVSTWNTKCGIAEYTRYLAESLDVGISYSIFADQAAGGCGRMGTTYFGAGSKARSQVNRGKVRGPSHGGLPYGASMSCRYNTTSDFLVPRLWIIWSTGSHADGIAVMITLHSTNHPSFSELVGGLTQADAVIVHRQEDLAKLLNSGVECAILQNQGIYVWDNKSGRRAVPGSQRLAFTVACFGFFLPPKGIRELLQAFEAAVQVNPALRLKLVNSLYPGSSSSAYAASCMRFVEERGLSERTQIYTEFWIKMKFCRNSPMRI